MSRFTDRIDRDLHQIADRATPSSTAWESIQQRIGEQDTQQTMEVIMLDPDHKKPPSRSMKLAAAAVAAAAVLIGGIVLATREDSSPEPEMLAVEPTPGPEVADPDPTVLPELVPTEVPEGVEPATEGTFTLDCVSGAATTNAETDRVESVLTCRAQDPLAAGPFDIDQQFAVTTTQREPGSAGAASIALSDKGLMYAGYVSPAEDPDSAAEDAYFVGTGLGAGPQSGRTLYFDGHLLARDNGVMHLNWSIDPELMPVPPSAPAGLASAQGSFDCGASFIEEVAGVQFLSNTCTIETDDPRLSEPVGGTIELFATEQAEGAPFSMRFFLARYENGFAGAGILSGDGTTRAALVSPGLGEFEGSLVHTIGSGQSDERGDLSSTVHRTVRAG